MGDWKCVSSISSRSGGVIILGKEDSTETRGRD